MPVSSGSHKRLDLLDSFRYLAILMVASYHYFHRFPAMYPYGAEYRHFVFFEYGYLGVQLFFMISGFVILMTLEKSDSIQQFLIKRLIRLFPTIVLCSIITYLTFLIFDQQNRLPALHSPLRSFIPSWTFTEPYFWELILGKRMSNVDGAYWSLAVEVKFYIVVAIVYFLSKKHFFRNWLALAAFAITVKILYQEGIIAGKIPHLLNIILFPKYVVLFTLGMFFFKIHKGEKITGPTLAVLVLFALCQIFLIHLVKNNWIEKLYLAGFMGLFVVLQYKSHWLSFLRISFLQRSGQASYALYLLHQNIGVFLILILSLISGSKSFLLPVAVFILLTFVSLLIYYRIEMPLSKFLKKRLVRSDNNNGPNSELG